MAPLKVLIAIFAKPPLPGEVKTRLARRVGAEGAAQLAAAFLADTWQAFGNLSGLHSVIATTEIHNPALWPAGAEIWLQGEGDLGARQENILRRALVDFRSAIVIGTDSPGLPPELLQAAVAALDTYDAVLGPSEDGGFYLLGLRRCPDDLLAHLPWSTEETLAATLQRLAKFQLKTYLLPTWFDVDVGADLDRLRTYLRLHPQAAPQTLATLRRLNLVAAEEETREPSDAP